MLIQMVAVNGHAISYQYDGLQRLEKRQINGGLQERYTYADGADADTTTTQVKEKKNQLNDNVVSNDFFYEYDAVGNITKETRYNYAQAAGSQNVPGEETVYTYDTLNQLISATYENGRVETYTYDNAGNILTFNNGTASHTMTYGNAQWKDLLIAVNNQAITYDAIGNPLTYYDGSTMVWGEGRRLQSISKNGQTTSYLYDADGLRIQKTNPDGSYIKYHLMNGRYLGETHYNAQNVYQKDIRYTYDQNDIIIGIGIRNSTTAAWTEYYFEKNLQGDIIAVYTAANGANGLPELVASYTYDSWGNILSATGTLAQTNPFRYRGYYYDTETSFYYLRSRYYNPDIGRFLNADAFASTGQGLLGQNMFAYCGNNPIMFIDQNGMVGLWVIPLIIIGKKIAEAYEEWKEDKESSDEVNYVGYGDEEGAKIEDSYKITNPAEMFRYVIKNRGGEISGSTLAVVYEWVVHDLMYYAGETLKAVGINEIGDTLVSKGRDLDVGSTIYDDSHGIATAVMWYSYVTTFPTTALVDLITEMFE